MKVTIEDSDLLRLIKTGKSRRYVEIVGNKKFLRFLNWIFTCFDELKDAEELEMYKFLHYTHVLKDSSVEVSVGKTMGRIFFTEQSHGEEIIVKNLYIKTLKNGKKGCI